MHFAQLPHDVRDKIKSEYLGWLVTNLHDPTHNFTKQTSPLVAWVEAWGDFCGGGPTPFSSQDETFKAPSPSANGDWFEGVIANVLFVDMARIWSFERSVTSYVDSAATTFLEYTGFVKSQLGSFYQQLLTAAIARGIVLPLGPVPTTPNTGPTGPPRRQN